MRSTRSSADPDTDELVQRASGGDRSAGERLLERHRDRLRRMVSVRLDSRLAARMDPSDVVQEVFVEAYRKLADYLQQRPLPFYLWLRKLTWEKVVDMHHRHVQAQKRSVAREGPWAMALPDGSGMELAERLVAGGTSPSARLIREELRERVRNALAELSAPDREVLVLRHLEQLSVNEIALVMGISEGAVKMRRLRAAQRLLELLGDDLLEGER